MTKGIYFRSSPSQFKTVPRFSWRSFRDTITRWGQPQILNRFSVYQILISCWFYIHRALVQEISSLFLKLLKRTSGLEEISPSWHQMEIQRSCEAKPFFFFLFMTFKTQDLFILKVKNCSGSHWFTASNFNNKMDIAPCKYFSASLFLFSFTFNKNI